MGLIISLWDEPPQSPMGHWAGLWHCLPVGCSWPGPPVLWVLKDMRPALLLLLPKVFFLPLKSQHALTCRCTSQQELLACFCGQDLALGLHPSFWSDLLAGGKGAGTGPSPQPCHKPKLYPETGMF